MSLLPTALNFGPFSEHIRFLMEIDKLKSVSRRTRLLNKGRYENSAEHSWHFAMAAMALEQWKPEGCDIQRVIRMALLHDIVEVDVGDVLVYDISARTDIAEKEAAAARRLFGLLPEPLSNEFLALWQEYEHKESADARFANAIDRLLPVIQNLHNEGQSWQENNIALAQVLSRNSEVAACVPELWEHIVAELHLAQQRGWLR